MSVLIRGGTVVTHLAPASLVAADVLVEDGRVALIGPSLAAPPGATIVDATSCVVLPGHVNGHMHAYSTLARGMPYTLAPPRNFLEILQRVWWRLDRALDAETIRASAIIAAHDALLAGTTTLVDHHASPNAIDGSLDIIAEAFAQVGVRSVLAYEVSDRDGPDRAAAGVAENARFIGRVQAGAFPIAGAMVGAHAAFTMSDQTLVACVDLARSTATGVHVHVAEDSVDAGAMVRLERAGAVDQRALLAHCVHVGVDEADRIRAGAAFVAHNARSNMNNGVGRAPVDLLGERVCLGTDGIGSDMWAEARAAFFRRREMRIDVAPEWAVARVNLGATLAGSIFGEPLLGTIEPGAPADLAVLDYSAPTPMNDENASSHVIFGVSARDVRDVVVAGELVVRDRRLTRVDSDALAADGRTQAARLWQRMTEIPAHEFSGLR